MDKFIDSGTPSDSLEVEIVKERDDTLHLELTSYNAGESALIYLEEDDALKLAEIIKDNFGS